MSHTHEMKDGRPGALSHLPYLAVVVLSHLVVFRDYWTFKRIFTGADYIREMVPLVNFQSDCMRELSWPLWNPFLNFGYPYVEHFLNSSFFPTHLVGGFLAKWSTELAVLDVLVWILLGGVGIYLCVVEYGYSKRAGVLAAICYMFSGQVVALPQWSIIVYNAGCFPFMLLGWARARRTGTPWSLISALFLAFSFLGGYLAAAPMGMYFFIGFVLVESFREKRLVFGLKFLAISVAAGLVMASPKVGPIFLSLADSPRFSPGYSGENYFFGILALEQLSSFVLPVKFYFSTHIGMIGMVAAAYMVFKKKIRIDGNIVMFFLGAWFLLVDQQGQFSLLHKLLSSTMPFLKEARLLYLYWFFPVAFLVLYVARGFDAIMKEPDRKRLVAAAGAVWVATAVVFAVNYDTSLHMGAFIFHMVMVLLILGAAIAPVGSTARSAAIIFLVLVEFVVVFERVNIDEPVVVEGDQIKIRITHQNGTSYSFHDDELVKNSWYYTITRDKFRPGTEAAKENPVLNIGTLHPYNPYTPEAMNFKYFSGLWYNSQEKTAFVRLKEDPTLPRLHGAALYSLGDEYSGGAGYRVSFDDITCSKFTFTTSSPTPAVFRLNQYHDGRWKAFVDGKEEKILTIEEYFMGVVLPRGEHEVRFVFRDWRFVAMVVAAFAVLFGLTGLTLWDRRRRQGR